MARPPRPLDIEAARQVLNAISVSLVEARIARMAFSMLARHSRCRVILPSGTYVVRSVLEGCNANHSTIGTMFKVA